MKRLAFSVERGACRKDVVGKVFLNAIRYTLFAVFLSGCATNWKTVREREMEIELQQMKGRLAEAERSKQDFLKSQEKLQDDLSRLQDQRADEIKRLMEEKKQESKELVEAKARLAESLKKELQDAQAKLAMTERGLVITFLDEIFFDSGKAEIKPEGLGTLAKVGKVLQETVPDSPVAVEGHTDNEPIRHSGWRSNWELATARALAVLHYFVNDHGVDPKRLRAVGFGEFHPVSSNVSSEGRRQNRRVEVVILPKVLTKVKPAS